MGPIRKEPLLTVQHSGKSSESLEGDRCRDRVQPCRLLTSRSAPVIVLSIFFSSMMANCIICQLSYVLMLLLATLGKSFFLNFLSLKYGVRMIA